MTTSEAMPPVPGTEDAPSRRSTVMSVTGLAASALIAVLTVLPAAYAIGGAGPTFDTLGEVDGEPLVSISGAPTYDSSGELRLTTVSVSRAGSQPFTLGRVLAGWASPRQYVVPEEQVFGTPEEEEQVEEQAQVDWVTSQESATVSALEALGVDVPATLTVRGTSSDSLADGLLVDGDVITAVDGAEVTSFSALADAVGGRAPGEDITVTYVRDGAERSETFATIDDGAGGAVIGVYVDPDFDLPIDVTVAIDSVGGPSAGLMFSLGIMDRLTPEDELAGALVAGTGTISAAGDVGAIGGIRMKMYGALDDGADWFLAPVANCADVRGNIPDGLTVVAVDTLDEAYDAIVRIGEGDTAGLPSC
ncbi:PDZ domain-containing protein [Demequina sp. SYSU T00039]|uniref:PDZ domain-containing protein n=1 Tax=Demequina lignilytica TaxID=3051663 RepID=A0AAW7M3H2_9MICO|nr:MULTISPECIES: PDZ domain-containing protein [unclassified Demequina]MDN4478241.1 PDZ domain-containing protein [Demequina sp. SYSU T00039-1]MDN4488309.1 PDZ domain-containing protein [Demequina sp. SYSU T00039]MDN4490144.1 PDZ domain-containing protein [Demequina sp. SYSU T00068]